MKLVRLFLSFGALSSLAASTASCSSGAESPGTGGAAGMAAAAGMVATGGAGGTTGTGGTTTATGGTTTTTGGTTPMGGEGGTGTGGTGNGGAGGTAGSSGSAGAGAGGTSGGAGGMGGGGMGGGGMGGGGMAGAGGSGGDLISVVGNWDGALVQFPCGNNGTGYDCANLGCMNNQVTKTTSWNIGGTQGQVYNVTFNVRGIVEPYAYQGGMRDGGSITNNLDLFQVGGMAQSSGGANYDYNTYEVDVNPPVAGKANVYFLNSVMVSEGPHANNSPTGHLTFPINYTKTIAVTGGGTVTLKVFDSNCTLVQNCGPTTGNTCAAPRTVPLSGVMPAAPASFMQPFQMPTGKYGQWVFFDITSVTSGP
jgi:hypothetical protein